MSTETTVPITITALRCTLAALAGGPRYQCDAAAAMLCNEIPPAHFEDGELLRGVIVPTPVEPAANTITAREVPPLSYTVLAGGLTPMGDPVDCYQVPRVGETLVVGDHRPYVTAVHWVTGREAEVRVSDTYAMEAI